jgi:hypothetical protein
MMSKHSKTKVIGKWPFKTGSEICLRRGVKGGDSKGWAHILHKHAHGANTDFQVSKFAPDVDIKLLIGAAVQSGRVCQKQTRNSCSYYAHFPWNVGICLGRPTCKVLVAVGFRPQEILNAYPAVCMTHKCTNCTKPPPSLDCVEMHIRLEGESDEHICDCGAPTTFLPIEKGMSIEEKQRL